MSSHSYPLPRSFAKRTDSFQESVIREMTRLGDECGSVNLSQGLPDFDSPPEILQAAVNAVQSGDNQYSFPFGTDEFRQAISQKTARYNRIASNPETEVTVTCGVSEAFMATILGLTEPGDEAIILEPWYENYVPDCILAGVTPHFVSMHEPDYTLDAQELRRAFNNHTRLIFINTPHNPTGRVFSREELEVIASLCQEFGVIAVTDEIYEHILYDGLQHISLGSLDGMQNLAVTISGLGKTYSVTGWRVGWTVAHEDISARIRKVHDYLTICAPMPFQAAGVRALQMDSSYYEKMRQEYAARRSILIPALCSAGFSCRMSAGAYYVLADFSKIAWPSRSYEKSAWTTDRCFAEYMAREVGVAVVPGSSFYASKKNGNQCVRFNFAKQPATLQEAARRLERMSR